METIIRKKKVDSLKVKSLDKPEKHDWKNVLFHGYPESQVRACSVVSAPGTGKSSLIVAGIRAMCGKKS